MARGMKVGETRSGGLSQRREDAGKERRGEERRGEGFSAFLRFCVAASAIIGFPADRTHGGDQDFRGEPASCENRKSMAAAMSLGLGCAEVWPAGTAAKGNAGLDGAAG